MPLPINLNSYRDVKDTLDRIIASGSAAKVPMSSRGAAINWRQRAYRFRKLYVQHFSGGNPTNYDNIVVRIDPADDKVVIVDTREMELKFESLQKPLDPPQEISIDTKLLDEAEELMKELGDEL